MHRSLRSAAPSQLAFPWESVKNEILDLFNFTTLINVLIKLIMKNYMFVIKYVSTNCPLFLMYV